ncbi:inactive dipeptidyl peptidase 10-like [Bacillus rossius redtenbacheri]|uniref:inactive dipeptidyl peptidase 10-like n=1 Tax=Bacillus rossius redtenbacheri TaxID=93214 RepID=UPI002FDCE269
MPLQLTPQTPQTPPPTLPQPPATSGALAVRAAAARGARGQVVVPRLAAPQRHARSAGERLRGWPQWSHGPDGASLPLRNKWPRGQLGKAPGAGDVDGVAGLPPGAMESDGEAGVVEAAAPAAPAAASAAPESEMDAFLLGRIGRDSTANACSELIGNWSRDKHQELVSSGPKQMNWRGILIALLVIVAVLGLIVFSIVLLSPPDEGPRVRGRKFSLDDVLGPLFRAPSFNGTWVSDVELVFRDAYGGVSILNAENLTTRVLMTNSTFRQLNAVDFKISSDLNFILLISDVRQVHTYSYEARYSIYEVESRNKYRLSTGEEEAADLEHPRLQLAVWAPDGNALAFVRGNDVYYKPRARAPEVHRVTSTGAPGLVHNGVPDWLYEEEILRSGGALWFSPDGQYLLFASFNDSAVGELRYPWYGGLKYPAVRTLRYPKAGTRNPAATLWAVDLNHPSQLRPVDLKPSPAVGASGDHYFTAVTWLAAHQVAVVWMNRRQNVSTTSVCREPLWMCEDVHTERAGEGGWVDVQQPPLFSSDGLAFLALLPVLDGDNGRFQHVCHVTVASKQVTALTHGAFQVTQLLRWDEDRGLVYFLAAPEKLPGERHLYRAKDLNSTTQSWDCLTCANRTRILRTRDSSSADSYSVPEGAAGEAEPGLAGVPRCLFSRAHFSPGPSPRYAVLECLGPDTPSSHLVDVVASAQVMLLDAHSALRGRYLAMARPQVRTFQVAVKSGDHAFVRLHLPPGLREYEEMIFPLVLHVCAEPGSQLVSERWGVDWGTYLASSRNFIVAQVDGRGSGFQGERVLQQLHHRFGSVEVEDQIDVIKYLRDNLNFVDREKVAVWGWGYGGFASAMILAEDDDVFKCGVSVAPITSWAHYDSVYTERYMGSPNVTDNYRGYEEADLTRRAAELRDKLYLLVHGTADERVHYQHSMALVRALAEEGVLFRHLTYPDEGHSFSGVQRHLHRAMEAFLDDCFGPINFEEWEVGTSFFSFKQ